MSSPPPDDARRPNGVTSRERVEIEAAEAAIEQSRARVAASLAAVRDEVASRGDWRAWVRAQPLPFVLGALVVGYLWGRGRGPSPEPPSNRRR
jgi:hypothetical protein